MKGYPVSVSTDSTKTIASAVDIAGVMNSFNAEIETQVIIEDVEVVPEVETSVEIGENEDTLDDSILRSDISWTSDAEILEAKKLLAESVDPLPSDSSIEPIQLDIGDQNIEINSLTHQLSEIEIIEP